MCHIALGLFALMPTFGLAGWTRSRGRRQFRSRTSLYQVVGEAKTQPRRWARIAKVPVGTCRYSGEVAISLIAAILVVVIRFGIEEGQEL